jgi:hypothetical protein
MVKFYGMSTKATQKAYLISVNGKAEWFAKSKTTKLGEMKGDDIIRFSAFETEDWLLIQNFGEDMTNKFIDAEAAILSRLEKANA